MRIVNCFVMVLFSLSCSKDKPIKKSNIVNTTDCSEMYVQRSIEYGDIYKGTLVTGSVLTPQLIFPDKYNYSQPCVNPNNAYEFCYLRRENRTQQSDDLDLFTYNFCTGKAHLIAEHVVSMPDWSVKDWIVFTGTNRKIWKVKSNGDSLTEFQISGYRAKWNTSGTKFVFNGNQLADLSGNLIGTLNIPVNFNTWLNDSVLIYNLDINPVANFEIFELNINSGIQKSIYSEPKNGTAGVSNYNKKSKNLYCISTNSGLIKVISINLETMRIDTIGISQSSFLQNCFTDVENNKVILQQTLSDSMTGNPSYRNFKSHIAIMERGGASLRHILFPE